MNVESRDLSAIRIADIIRGEISRGLLGPGLRLSPTDLRDKYHVSPLPIREALSLLLADGTVEHETKRGFFVAKVSRSEAEQLYRLFELLETDLIDALDWPDEAQLATFDGLFQKMQEQAEATDWTGFWETYQDFHTRIMRLSQRETLLTEMRRVWRMLTRYSAYVTLPRRHTGAWGLEDAEKMLAALRAQDREALRETCLGRLNEYAQLTQEAMEERGL